MTAFLADDPAGPPIATLLLAHGAGAAPDSPAMTGFAAAAAGAGIAVRRFAFGYMAEATAAGRRRPPPPIARLVPEYAAALEHVLATTAGPVLIGGKSMGGRVATMLAGAPLDARVRGVVVYGYPFHPQDKPETTRLDPIRACRLPLLILQGTRDPFGNRTEVESYDLPAHVTVRWFEDGDHDLTPRASSGRTAAEHLVEAAEIVAGAVAGWTG